MKNLLLVEMSEKDMQSFISETIQKEFKKLVLPENNTQDFELLTRKESCSYLGISQPTLYKLQREGFISPRIVGSIIRFAKSDLEKAFGQVNNLKGRGGKNEKF